MADNSKARPKCVSASDFLSALEHSGVLPDEKWRAVRERFVQRTDLDDPSVLARQLVKEGTLTPFQGRRLLKKKSLVFGRYILLDHIGQGARGRVFKARHSLMDRVVALKAVLSDPASDERAVARFFREMKIVSLLDHPNVVRAIDADEHQGRPYIIMEYLRGQDLEQVFGAAGPCRPMR